MGEGLMTTSTGRAVTRGWLRPPRVTAAFMIVLAVSFTSAGCGSPSTAGVPTATVASPIPNDPAEPYAEVICGQTWEPKTRAVPGPTQLVRTAPAPAAPTRSSFPTPQPDIGGADTAFKFGDCATGAIVTISPIDAVDVIDVFHAADGGVVFLTLTPKPGRSYVLRAWSDGGAYLGEHKAT